MANSPINVGIAGLGRSGYSIHKRAACADPQHFRIAAVADEIPERLREVASELGCRAYDNFDALISDPDVELVIVATYNYLHAEHTAKALKAGKHALCEKPFGLSVSDADSIIAAAKASKRKVFPFQQRRYEPDFRKVKEIVDSGILGEIVHIRICWQDFSRRWDWQTTRERAGGALNNNGPHLLDHAMLLFGDKMPKVWAEARRCLCSGDAEDHLKVILSGAGRPTVEFELTSVWAYPQDRWTVCGTRGGLRGGARKLEWKWVDFDALPPRPLDMRPTPDRSYNHEKLPWQTAVWEPEGRAQEGGAGAPPPAESIMAYYADMHRAIREGARQVVTPQSVRRRIAVMEKIRKQAGIPAKA